MKSLYDNGRCICCGQRIAVGDEIIRGPNGQGWQHDQGDGQGCPADYEGGLWDAEDIDPAVGDR